MLRSLAVAGTLAAVSLLAYGVRATPESTARAADPARPAIAVLPFSVLGDPAYEYLGEGLVDLLSANLDGAGELRAIDPRALLSAASRRRTQSPDPEAARAVAERLGARWFVLGTVVEAGGRLRISAILYGREPAPAATGPAATAPPAVARAVVEGPATALFALVDRLTADLLADVYRGPSDRLMRTAALTSSSLDALKAYLGGEQHLRGGRYAEAMDAFERATRTDSMFALAHYRRAVAAECPATWKCQIGGGGGEPRQARSPPGRPPEPSTTTPGARVSTRGARRGRRGGGAAVPLGTFRRAPRRLRCEEQARRGPLNGNANSGPLVPSSRAAALERVLALEPDYRHRSSTWWRIAARTGAARGPRHVWTAARCPSCRPAERQ
jgi:TolB-like protein